MDFARKRRENRAKLQVELFSTCFKRGLSRRAEASPELCNCRAEKSFAVAQDDNEDRILKYHPLCLRGLKLRHMRDIISQ